MYRLRGSQNSIIIFLWYLWELLHRSYHSFIFIHLTAAISLLWVSQETQVSRCYVKSCQPAITSKITPTVVPMSPVHQMLHTQAPWFQWFILHGYMASLLCYRLPFGISILNTKKHSSASPRYLFIYKLTGYKSLHNHPITAKLSKIPLYWHSWFGWSSYILAIVLVWFFSLIGYLLMVVNHQW